MIGGGCLCGAVRFEISAEPIVTRMCWCRDCQYFAAGNATVNLAFPSDSFTITGELSCFSSLADSGRHMHRRFCPKCGTHLFSEAEERPHLIVVRAGAMDDATLVRPDAVIWTTSAPHWAEIDPSCEQFERQPPPPAINNSDKS